MAQLSTRKPPASKNIEGRRILLLISTRETVLTCFFFALLAASLSKYQALKNIPKRVRCSARIVSTQQLADLADTDQHLT